MLYFGAGAFTQDARVIQGAKIGVLPFVLSLGTGVIVRIVLCIRRVRIDAHFGCVVSGVIVNMVLMCFGLGRHAGSSFAG